MPYSAPRSVRAVMRRSSINSLKTYRNFSAGAQIMQRGAPLEFAACVVTGVVLTLSKTLEDGRKTVLLLASHFIGRPERIAIDFDFTATTDVVLCCFQRANFKAMLDMHPASVAPPIGNDAG